MDAEVQNFPFVFIHSSVHEIGIVARCILLIKCAIAL